MTSGATPAGGCRRRRRLLPALVLLVSGLPAAGVVVAASGEPAGPCSAGGTGWCVARRFPGSVRAGELGFRFGEPLDADGDGRADVAAGARFKLWHGDQQNGDATVWSGADGAPIRAWDGEWPDARFGHSVLPVPDLSGDGLADLVVAAPHARVDGQVRGILVARSPKTGEQIWTHTEGEGENLGWDLALAGDQDGDGHVDLFVGAPAEQHGRVLLVSGRDGRVLRTYAPPGEAGTFGWYVARTDDLDGDGHPDLAVGAPSAASADGARVGGAWVLSSASGRELHHWTGIDARGGFGSIVAALGDLDGDGHGEVAVAAPGTEDQTRTLLGEVFVYSGGTGKQLRHWSGSQPGELFGRMVVSAGDLDGDGTDDVAIGAPLRRRGSAEHVGRVELRSGRDGAVLDELVGDQAEAWFGWHVRRAPDPGGRGRPALLIASLRHTVDGKVGVGLLDLYVLRPAAGAGAQGTVSAGARRNDIK